MAFERAAGVPDYNAAGFKPVVYSTIFNAKYYATSRLVKSLQSKYFNELKNAGEKVIVPVKPTVRGGKFTTGGTLIPKAPTSVPIEITLSKQYAWCFIVNDQDDNRSHLNLDGAFKEDAVENTAVYAETQFLGGDYVDPAVPASGVTGRLCDAVAATNKGTAAGAQYGGYDLGSETDPVAVDSTNITSVLQDMNSCLNENNIPQKSRRHYTMPEMMRGIALNSELKAANISGDNVSQLRTGKPLQTDGADYWFTNCYASITGDSEEENLPGMRLEDGTTMATGKDSSHPVPIFCWTEEFAAYGGVLSKIETTRVERGFGTIYKGLYLYDWKVLLNTAIAVAWVYKK